MQELGANSVPLLQELAEAADPERLRCVVTCRNEGDAALAAVGHRALGGLAGDERVQAGGDGLVEVVGAGAGDDADRADRIRAVGEGQRLAIGRCPHALDELGGADGVQPRADADGRAVVSAEGLDVGSADRLREQRVVADLEVAVEWQVVGGERDVGVEEQLQPPLGRLIERPWRPKGSMPDAPSPLASRALLPTSRWPSSGRW